MSEQDKTEQAPVSSPKTVEGENELNQLFSASRMASLPLQDASKSMDHVRLAAGAKKVLALLQEREKLLKEE